MSGFYYDIYPPAHIGRSPEPPVFSVRDQGLVEQKAMARLKWEESITIRQYQRMGAWYPEHLPRTVFEANGGDIVSLDT